VSVSREYESVFLFQVRYAVREYACTAVDVLARRLRLAFLNVQAAEEALDGIIRIMAEELGWSKAEQAVSPLESPSGRQT